MGHGSAWCIMVNYLRETTSSGDAFGRDLLPQSGIGSQNTTRLPDWLALEVGGESLR